MARYGDLDSVKLKVQRYLIPNTDIDGTVDVAVAERWFLKLLDEEPTVDVAPKSEVAREIFEEIEKHECHGIAGQAVMYMIFAEEYAELKKKYTEENE